MELFAKFHKRYKSKELNSQKLNQLLEETHSDAHQWLPFLESRMEVVRRAMGRESPKVTRLDDFYQDVVQAVKSIPRSRADPSLVKTKKKDMADKCQRLATKVREAVTRFRREENRLFDDCAYRVKLDLETVKYLANRRKPLIQVRDSMAETERLLADVRHKEEALAGPTDDCWIKLRRAHDHNRTAMFCAAGMTDATFLEQFLGTSLGTVDAPSTADS